MRQFLIAAVGVAALSTSAVAADLGAKVAPQPVVAAPVFTWSGFYIGANVGGAWARGHSRALNEDAFDDSERLTTVDTKGSGVIGGGQLGYNWQLSPNWLVGVELEAGWVGIDNERIVVGDPASGDPTDQNMVRVKYQGFGAFTGRVGWVNGPWLLYGKGGLAVARIKNEAADVDASAIDPTDLTSVSDTRTGFAAGGGLEWAYTSNWTVKVEYLFMDFGDKKSSNLDGDFFKHENQLHTVRVGLNYKFAP